MCYSALTAQIDIHYERVAKRINVKQLKSSMWEELLTEVVYACNI